MNKKVNKKDNIKFSNLIARRYLHFAQEVNYTMNLKKIEELDSEQYAEMAKELLEFLQESKNVFDDIISKYNKAE